MIRHVYLGAVEYAAGEPTPIEQAVTDGALCERLRHASHGAALFARHDSNIFELVEASVRRTLASGRIHASEVDAVFFVSNMLDAQNNLDTAWLGAINARLGLNHASHYHVGITGCGGFHWAARLAAGLIASADCERILIVSFDKAGGTLERVYGQGTDFLYVTGDAAASCIVSSDDIGMNYQLIGKVVNLYDGAQILTPSMDSEIRTIVRLFGLTYESASITTDDVDFLITNNYSLEISRLYCQLADLSYSKAYTGTIATHAHCFSSDNLINLHHLRRNSEVRDGQRVLLFSTGPSQWGACVLENISPRT